MAQQIAEITKVPTNAQVIKILNQIIKRYNSLGDLYQYKGSVQTYDDLLAIQNPQIGDVYNVIQEDAEEGIAAGSNFAWNGTEWDNLGGSLAGLVQSINGINPDSLGNVLLPLIKNITTNQGAITFTKNDDTTIQVDNIKKLTPIVIKANTDLNDITEAGIYICGSDADAATYENCPIQKSFLLEVQGDYEEHFSYQFLTQYNDGSTEAGNQYVRTYQVTNGWSAWRMAGSGSNLTTYTSLEQIGITPGEETFASIHSALPINSVLSYYYQVNYGLNDNSFYPANYGYVKFTKQWNTLLKCEFVRYTTTDEDSGKNIGIYYTTYYSSAYPNRLMIWNRHINSQDTAPQNLHSTLAQAVIDDSQVGVGIADYAGYSKDGLRRIGGLEITTQIENNELRNRNVLYVVDDNIYHSTIYSDWSPSQNRVVTTMQGLVKIPDHIQFIGKDNGQFGYTEVTSGTGVKTIPRGNYFFYGTAGAKDSDTVLAGSDFQGISMRQSDQAFQIVCQGNKIFWRYDEKAGAATNPSYSAWYLLATSADNGWIISRGTNGWARETYSGFTIQWGFKDNLSGGNNTISFPRTFSTVYQVVPSFQGAGTYENSGFHENSNPTNSNFLVWTQYGGECRWIAVGIS